MEKETKQKKTSTKATAPKAEKSTTVKVAKPRTATKTVTVVDVEEKTTKAPAKKTCAKKETVKKETVKKETTKKATTAKKVATKKEAKPIEVVETVEVETSIFEKASRLPNGEVMDIVEEPTQNKTKVLYVASECLPFCATGGLADVAGSLPKFIAQNDPNIDMRVVLPLYSDIPSQYRDNFTFIGHKNISVAWRQLYLGVFSYKMDNVTYYFLDNEYYFKRNGGIYSYYDDGERFAYVSNAVIEMLSMVDFKPDIIHANDWQSALIPIYLKTRYKDDPELNKIKTVFTLHNSEYQGKFDIKIMGDVFGIDTRYRSLVEYNKDLNLVKGAIVTCDKFTTVSPTYAEEILTSPEFSNGLNPIISENRYKTSGILNGIDYDFYNPKTDDTVFKNYDIDSFEAKKDNKVELQKMFGLNVDPEIPMLSIVTRMANHKGIDLIKDGIEQILSQRVQLVIVGSGTQMYENFFKYLEQKYQGKVKASIGYSNTLARKAYAASDIFIMPSRTEPCGLSQMVASRYGAVPIVRETGGLKDSIRDFGCENGGNGYTFYNYSSHDLVYSINRAIQDFYNKDAWVEKVKTCMKQDFTWKGSAIKYIELYRELV